MTLTDLASIAYAANRAYAKQLGEQIPPWPEAGDEDRQIWRQAVRYHLIRPGASPEDLQEEWLRLEHAAGWSYGPRLDNEARHHPCHVAWHQLAPEHRCKVILIRDVIHAVVACNAILHDPPEGEKPA